MVEVSIPPPAASFEAFGIPKSKGSKRAFVRGGRAMVVEETKEQQRAWSAAVSEAIREAVAGGAPMLEGPVVALMEFVVPRPKSAPKTRRTWPQTRPDLGKYLRLVEDLLTGALLRDDSQIVEFATLRKRYTEGEERPGVRVELWDAEDYYGMRPDRHHFFPGFTRPDRCAKCWRPEDEHAPNRDYAQGGS